MKISKICLSFVFILILSSIVFSAPAWKKQPTTPTTPTTPTEPKIIIINQTVPAQSNDNLDWNMIGGIAAIVGILVALAGWLLTRKKSSATSKHINEISKVYSSYKNNPVNCELKLLDLKKNIENEFTKNKLTEQSYDILDRKIESYISEIRKGVVKREEFSLSHEEQKIIDKVLEDGIITGEEYKKVSKLNLKGLSKEKKERLMYLMNKWKEKK